MHQNFLRKMQHCLTLCQMEIQSSHICQSLVEWMSTEKFNRVITVTSIELSCSTGNCHCKIVGKDTLVTFHKFRTDSTDPLDCYQYF